jgi:uncharacterized protein with PIN domain
MIDEVWKTELWKKKLLQTQVGNLQKQIKDLRIMFYAAVKSCGIIEIDSDILMSINPNEIILEREDDYMNRKIIFRIRSG